MVDILVLDDSKADCDRVVESLRVSLEEKLEYQLKSFTNSTATEILSEKYDVYFLDIDMPGQDGITVAKKIRERYDQAILIFVTSHDNLVFKSFEANPFQFVRKNYFEDDFRVCVELLLKKLHDPKLYYSYNFNNVITNVKYNEIQYFEKQKNDLFIYTSETTHRNRENLSYVEMLINHPTFVRTHNSFLVNLDYVKKLDDVVELWDGRKLPVSRTKVKEVREKYMMYLKGKL